jgi:hypothetical protein
MESEDHKIRGVGSATATYKLDENFNVVNTTLTPGDGPEFFVCSCGQEFSTEESAREHLAEVA